MRSAFKSGDYVRAAIQANRFLAEAAGDEAMTKAIETILESGADSLARQFAFALKRHSAESVLNAAISQEHSGPFGLAASAA